MTLDEQYQKVIGDQRAYLLQLQKDFNVVCENAKVKAREKLQRIPKEDSESRTTALKEQKEPLDKALGTLKQAVSDSTRKTMKELESIVRQKEEKILQELEDELATL